MEMEKDEVLDRRVWKNIEFNARRLASNNAVCGMDAADYKQDIVLDLIRRRDQFDPGRSSFTTFADRLVVHRAATLANPTLRQFEERRMLSLDFPIVDEEGQPSTYGALLPDTSSPTEDDLAVQIDVRRFVRALPSVLQQACSIQLGDSVSAEAKAAGLHRSTIYDRNGRVRERAVASGLGVYFRGKPDSSEASPVCGCGDCLRYGPEPPAMLEHTTRLQAQLLITADDLHAWIADVAAGSQLEYFRGFLAIDRVPVGSRLPAEHVEKLNRVANSALALSEAGRVHLVQRRLRPGEYSYICIARRRGLR